MHSYFIEKWLSYSLYNKILSRFPKASASWFEDLPDHEEETESGCVGERLTNVREAGAFGEFRGCLANRQCCCNFVFAVKGACGKYCCSLSPCSECPCCSCSSVPSKVCESMKQVQDVRFAMLPLCAHREKE